jgi:hypothetical protein
MAIWVGIALFKVVGDKWPIVMVGLTFHQLGMLSQVFGKHPDSALVVESKESKLSK